MVAQFSGLHLVVLLASMFSFALFIWALVSISKSNKVSQSVKLLWVLLVIFVPFLGSILWFGVGARSNSSRS